jgi:hypothetical protein
MEIVFPEIKIRSSCCAATASKKQKEPTASADSSSPPFPAALDSGALVAFHRVSFRILFPE